MSRWRKAHKSSGATVIERNAHGCRLVVVPVDWVKPNGPAHYVVTCGGSDATHARGRRASMADAKKAAMLAAKNKR